MIFTESQRLFPVTVVVPEDWVKEDVMFTPTLKLATPDDWCVKDPIDGPLFEEVTEPAPDKVKLVIVDFPFKVKVVPENVKFPKEQLVTKLEHVKVPPVTWCCYWIYPWLNT